MPWIRVPVHTPMTPYTVYEHTPAYSYKEYPRDINRVGWQAPVHEFKFVEARSEPPLPRAE